MKTSGPQRCFDCNRQADRLTQRRCVECWAEWAAKQLEHHDRELRNQVVLNRKVA
jgi:hypothetical protein